MSKPRMSALPLLQYCGKAQDISATGAGGRSSAIGTAFHALCSKAPDAEQLAARLSDKEREQLAELIPPKPILVGTSFDTSVELTYEEAHKEVRVLVREDLMPVMSEEDAFLTGTVDLFWVFGKTLYVADIKKTSFAAPDGPASLQVIGYAVALLSILESEGLEIDGYYTGIWDATEGQWEWSDYVDIWSNEHQLNCDRVLGAARNYGGEFNLGSHCRSCYGRTRCPQYLLPPDVAGEMLEQFKKEGGISPETALPALLAAQRAVDSGEEVIRLLKAYADQSGGIPDPSSGKVYAPITCKGRVTLDRARLESENPELVERYSRTGTSYQQFRWLKPKKDGK